MLRRFFPLFVVAFLVGLLFKLGDQYQVPVLRMFGTQGIVVIGIWGAWILRSLQREDGIRRVEEGLGAIGPGVRVRRVGSVRSLPLWMVDTGKGKILLGASDVAESVGESRAARTLGRQARQMLAAARDLGALEGSERIAAALVLLRKRVNGERRVDAGEGATIALVNPEGLSGFIGTQSF